MSEAMINSLFRDLEDGLSELITFSRASVSKTTGNIIVYFQAKRLLTKREERQITKAVAGGFPGTAVQVKFRYFAIADEVREDIAGYRSYIGEKAAELSPGVTAFILRDDCTWTLEGDELTIDLIDKNAEAFMRTGDRAALIEKTIKALFDIDVSVRFTVSNLHRKMIERVRAENDANALPVPPPQEETAPASGEEKKTDKQSFAMPEGVIMGKAIYDPSVPMREITESEGNVVVTGGVLQLDVKETRTKTKIATFIMGDADGSCELKAFISGKRNDKPEVQKIKEDAFLKGVQVGSWLKVRGKYSFDDYSKKMVLNVQDIMPAKKPCRMDTCEEKRVELHMHTSFSAMDACTKPDVLIKQAAAWGHKAVAITDHGVVQAFPDAFSTAKKAGIKFIPGCEGYLIDDSPEIVTNADSRNIAASAYVVLDFETTGLNTATDKIIEIGAVRIENGSEVAEFTELIDPETVLPDKVIELTGINMGMLNGKRTIEQAIGDFAEFCKDAVLVAHNASFDTAFLKRALEDAGLPFEYPVIDTLALSRNLFPDAKNHKLGTLCKMLDIDLRNAHRAVHDARATGLMLFRELDKLREEKNVFTLDAINSAFDTDAGGKSWHIILLATCRKGMVNLNRLITESHLNYFHRRPRIPRGLITKWREGLLIGSACEAGELYRAIVEKKSEAELERIASFYDYLEIQPIGNNHFMVENGTVESDDVLRDFNQRIVDLGERMGKPVVATCDVHFKEPEDAIYRTVLLASQGFEDADNQAPLYFRTTNEMLDEFSYLGSKEAHRVVIEAPNEIASRIEQIDDLFMKAPDGGETFQPFWPEAESELRQITHDKAVSIYGDPLPEIVQARLDKELGSICGYGFSTLYMIAVKLVRKSMSDGYIVGSRGSVGSSFVANMAGITEVNSLPPHYVCPNCKHSIWEVDKEYDCGLDLPDLNCPKCGTLMNRDGFNIPFEVFLGFKGDKVPDIDLNFSGEYQPTAQNYVKVLFGTENVFRAGTIGTVAEKTAFGYAAKYAEERGLNLSYSEKVRLAAGITDIKRTTGQHPAGMVVLPEGYEIYEFTAVQHPADDIEGDTLTTHFTFKSMHDILVKLDILGHDDPTMLRNLQDITGIAPQQVPLWNKEIFSKILTLFSSTEALGVTPEQIGTPVGTFGIPEFGTRFVRGMLLDTKPTTMDELVRISGLSHGTNVWANNIQDLILNGTTTLKSAICTRDDIMNQLIAYGVDPKTSFDTMEYVRKGKAAKDGGLKKPMADAMHANNVPQWFEQACNKIGYMFPKAHAVAYVTMALRIAYFKIYYPAAYYACYLLRNIESFDASKMIGGAQSLRTLMQQDQALDKEERERKDGEITILEALIEMNERGIHMKNVDLYESDAGKFIILDDHTILPPICTLPGIGLNAAQNVVNIRKEGPFISRDDMIRRKVGKSVVETLATYGCLEGIPEMSQTSFFETGLFQ